MSLCKASHENFPRMSNHESKCSSSEDFKPNVFNVVLSIISSRMVLTIPVFVPGKEFFSIKTAQTISRTMGICRRPEIPAVLACFNISRHFSLLPRNWVLFPAAKELGTAFNNVAFTESFNDNFTIHCASEGLFHIFSSSGC